MPGVNTHLEEDLMGAEAAVTAFLAGYSAEVRELAYRVRTLVFTVWPEAVEQVHGPQQSIGYSVGQKMAEVVYVIMPLKTAVNLGFARGSELPDPARLLAGTGKRARHVKISTTADLENPAVRALLEAAVAAGP
jgi:hypothetical protein